MPAGRPTKFNPEVAETILAAVRKGCYLHVAAAAAGVGRRTLNKWLERGKGEAEEDSPYREFRQGYLKARALARIDLELRVNEDGKIDGKMALEILSRLWPEEWSAHRGEIRKLRQEIEELKALIVAGRKGVEA